MKKIIFILVIYLFFTGPVMAFIIHPPGSPNMVAAPLALLITGMGLLGLGKICRQILNERKRQAHPRMVMRSAKA